MRMARGLDFGCVWINTHIPLVAEMPHGGFKHSGYGKDLSMYGFEDYTRIKHVMSPWTDSPPPDAPGPVIRDRTHRSAWPALGRARRSSACCAAAKTHERHALGSIRAN